MFHHHWNKAAASQIFPVDFIHFLISDSSQEIVNILIYLTKYTEILIWMMEQKIFCVKTCYKTKSFKQDTERSLISTHFQTRVRFSS